MSGGRLIRYAIERHQMQRRAAAQLLHQTALHQLEITGGATADLQGLARAAASAVRVGLDVEWVSVRFVGDSLPDVAAATEVGDLLAPGEIDVEGDVTTTVELQGDNGTVGRIDVPIPGDGGLTTDQRRFVATAAASITTRVDRLVAELELKARNRQLNTVQRVAAQLQREHDPGAAVARVAALLVEGLQGHGDLGVTVEVEGNVMTAGSHVGPGGVAAEAPVTVRGEERGSIALLRDAAHALGPQERTALDGVAAQLGTWWALARADRDHRRDLDGIVQLMEAAPVGLALVDADGQIRFANAAALELVGVDTVEEFPWRFDESSEDGLDPALAAVTRARRTGTAVRDVRVTLPRAHGADHAMSVNASPLAPGPDGTCGMAVAISDVTTERRRAVLLESALDREARSAEELRRVGAPQRAEHDLSDLVVAIVELLPTTEHVLALHLEPTPTHVDRRKIERVIHNLVGNAIRHTPPGTTISVTTQRQADAAVLVVDDDGPGIPAREWEDVFEPFSQGSRAASSANPGTGVGLSLVRRFVELHDGTVDLDVGPSGGARFTVVLPDRV